ncbi:MAG: SMC family ATPase, partial [Bacteroidales bacterium]|nr:SMC family ATPase [Bacteroidales bacterium]
MKFKTLNINNIASIETATIDFQEVHFANESLFLIYGDTGSGKTTILDAICLALYKETPRMKQSKSDKYVDESLIVRKSGENDGIQVSDERQYMRRGTKSAFVELTFLGNDEKNYTARIEFGVTRTGNLQKTIWTLTTGNTIFDRDKDIKNAINNAIGLDYEQFCRTTMLAQGEFTKFLRSDEKDKSGILEKLTGTDIYSKIGAKIYQRFKAKEDEWKFEQAKLGVIQLLDDEAIENLQKEMLQLKTNNETQSKQRSVLSSRKIWLETENQLKKDCQTAEDALNKWNDIALQPDYQIQRQTIAQWHNTTEERRAFHFLKELQQEKENNNNLGQSLKLQFSKLVAGDAWYEQGIQKKTLEIKDIQSFLNEQKPFIPMYAESQTINVKLIQYVNDINESRKYYHQVEAEQKKLPELEKDKNINDSKRVEIESLLEVKNKEILQQQQQLDALNKKNLQQKNNQCQTLLNEIQIAENQLNRRDEAKANLDSIIQQEIETDQLIKSLNQKKDELEPQLTQVKKEVEQAELLLNKSKESVGDYAKAMRATLQPGDCCPVCGQKVIHLERDEDFEKALQPVLQNFIDKKSEFEKIQTTINQFNADIKAQTLSLKTIQKKCNDKRMVFETMVEQTNDNCAKIGVDAYSITLLDDIQQLKNQQNEELQHVQQLLHQVDEWQKNVNNLQKEKEQLIEKHNIAKDAVQKSEHAIEQCRNLIQRSSDLAIQKQQSAEEAKQSVAEKILYPDWEQNIETTLQLLKDDTKEYANQVEKNQTLSNALNLEKNNQEQSKLIRQQIENNFPLWQVEVSMAPVENLTQAWSRLLEETISLKTKKAKNEEETKNNLQKIDHFFTANDNFQPEDLTRLANISRQTINQWEQILKELDEKGQLFKGAFG